MARAAYLLYVAAAVSCIVAGETSAVEVYFRRGLSEASRGEFAEARNSYLAALKLRPESASILYNLALVEVKLGHGQEAVKWLRRAASVAPRDVAVWQALLAAEMEVKSAAHVVSEVSRKLTGIVRREEPFFVQLAKLLAERGHTDTAADALRHAAGLWPSSWRLKLKHNLALLYYLSGCLTDAHRTAVGGLAIEESAQLRYLAGEIESALGHSDRAVESFQRAIHLEPGNELYRFALGYTFLEHREFAAALDVFSRAAARLPPSSKLHVGLSGAYFGRAECFISARELIPRLRRLRRDGGRAPKRIRRLLRVIKYTPLAQFEPRLGQSRIESAAAGGGPRRNEQSGGSATAAGG